MSAGSLYVYYKIEPARLEELRGAIEALFAALERDCGVRGRWLRRRDDAATYMEVYEGVADLAALERALERETARPGLARLLPAPRRHEVFVAA